MDETLQELENELTRLTPRRPSAGLMQALEHELGQAPAVVPAPRYSTATSLRSWKWATWSLAGLAAAIALVLVMQSNRPNPRPAVSPGATLAAAAQPVPVATRPVAAIPANRYEPVRATSVLYDLQESAPAKLADQTEGREVRYRYVDTYTWKNPATNASLRWSVPRDEVRVVRASLD